MTHFIAVEADPTSATYRSNRAAAYMSAGDYVHALEDCKVADELSPDNEKTLHRMARIYTSLGRPDEALDVYDRIKPPASAKDRAPAVSMKGHITQAEQLVKDGTGSMAMYALDQAVRGLGQGVFEPRKWKLLRGEAYLKQGTQNSFGDAQNIAMSMLRTNSADPDALVMRGRALYGQGENEKAIQHFRQALSCDPDYKEAVRFLRMVQKLDKQKEEGNAHFKAGRYQDAVRVYTTALEVDPSNKGTNSKILQNRALCHSKLKAWKAAVADCDKALALDPTYTKAKKTRAKALGEDGDWEEAVRVLKDIAEKNPNEPNIAREIRQAEIELKKSKRKDYYKILGVDKDAGDSEIKKAYRKLAIVHHPDKVSPRILCMSARCRMLIVCRTQTIPRLRIASRTLVKRTRLCPTRRSAHATTLVRILSTLRTCLAAVEASLAAAWEEGWEAFPPRCCSTCLEERKGVVADHSFPLEAEDSRVVVEEGDEHKGSLVGSSSTELRRGPVMFVCISGTTAYRRTQAAERVRGYMGIDLSKLLATSVLVMHLCRSSHTPLHIPNR